MNKSRTLFATLAVGALIGLGAACSAPASDAPSSVVTRVVHHGKQADTNQWITEAVPVLTDVTAHSTALADNPLDQANGAALGADATHGLNLTVTSGDAHLDAAWHTAMVDTRRLSGDVKAQDLAAITKDADKGSADMQALNNAVDAFIAKSR